MRVIIAEDEALIRRGLELVLREGGHDVVAAVGDAEEMTDAVGRERPDLVITDIRMPPTHTDEGLVAALRIRREHPEIGVVVLSQHVQRRYAQDLLAHGAERVGYLLKQRIADVGTFLGDLERVATGGTALDPDVVAVMMGRARHSEAAISALTSRQQEVLSLVAEGRSNASIAAALFLTEKAVVQHVSRIYDALGLALDGDSHRRVRAVIQYLNRG
ncbi:response regulator transcription factor [Microbacterium sp. CFH 90308]|uniref:Response regulator transcription factor n=1 Tax=Microbacterium salsuginis TaxID=2722803 RepID=A0ABX1KCC5_9MICO|nr:response regulator transcription factor [Microbacterium sp. CFH 90308]NLP84687.1 response regulator transcription factor [Microbacterium sp. CFH 90308]